jgi:cysteine desulfuration protein SufE
MKSIQDKQNQIVQEFSDFKDWETRYQHIISLGKNLSPLADEFKIEQNKVKGCQSQVWLHATLEEGKIIYQADSDAFIVRGLASILVQVFSEHSPAEILASSTEFLSEIGLTQHLSQSRANGLASMVRQFKNYAIAFQALLGK